MHLLLDTNNFGCACGGSARKENDRPATAAVFRTSAECNLAARSARAADLIFNWRGSDPRICSLYSKPLRRSSDSHVEDEDITKGPKDTFLPPCLPASRPPFLSASFPRCTVQPFAPTSRNFVFPPRLESSEGVIHNYNYRKSAEDTGPRHREQRSRWRCLGRHRIINPIGSNVQQRRRADLSQASPRTYSRRRQAAEGSEDDDEQRRKVPQAPISTTRHHHCITAALRQQSRPPTATSPPPSLALEQLSARDSLPAVGPSDPSLRSASIASRSTRPMSSALPCPAPPCPAASRRDGAARALLSPPQRF